MSPSLHRRIVISALVWAGWLGAVAPPPVSARELVRVRISQFTGAEPAEIDSGSHPELFVLDPAVKVARLGAFNPLAPVKENRGPARWLPLLTPADDEGGAIFLEVTLDGGTPVAPTAVEFKAAAHEASKPSTLVVGASFDDFVGRRDVIDLAAPSRRRVALDGPESENDFTIRWFPANDFGDFGGGEAGFVDDDVVVSGDVATRGCPPSPAPGCFEPGRSRIKMGIGFTEDAVAWSWSLGTVEDGQFGDPTTTTGYALCTYDDDVLVKEQLVPAGASCGLRPCWRALRRRGFSYTDRAGRNGDVTRVILKPGFADAEVTVGARGESAAPSLPLADTTRVVVQLMRTDEDTCWTSAFDAPAAVDTERLFRDAR